MYINIYFKGVYSENVFLGTYTGIVQCEGYITEKIHPIKISILINI